MTKYSIAGTIFNNQLVKELSLYASNLSPQMIQAVKQSVIVIFQLPKEQQAAVVHSYVKALKYTFILSVPTCVCAALAATLIKNWNLKKRGGMMPGGAA